MWNIKLFCMNQTLDEYKNDRCGIDINERQLKTQKLKDL